MTPLTLEEFRLLATQPPITMMDRLATAVTSHRPAPMLLLDDPMEPAAMTIALINGNDALDGAAAIETLTKRIGVLVEADSPEALHLLAAQLPVLSALFNRFATDAIAAKQAAHKSILLRMSLAAQQNYARTQALIAGLKMQREGKAQVSITETKGDS